MIKTPSNAYRLGFLRALFPGARIRVLHLTRNPAASLNGLYDGWRHNGFHAHRMDEPLEITGYAEDCPADRWWWKFDLPPGWRRYTRASLIEVCAFQWYSCHRAVLDGLAGGDIEHIRVRFEDLISGPQVRVPAFERLAGWLGVPFDGSFRRAVLDGVAPVAATAPPSPGRWRSRAGMIEAGIDERVRSVAEELDYAANDDWI